MLRHIPELLLSDPNVDMLVYGMPTSQLSDWVSQEIVSMAAAASKPVAIVWTGHTAVASALARLRAADIPVFEQIEACIRAVRAMFWYAEFCRSRSRAGSAPSINAGRQAEALRRLSVTRGALSEHDSKELLALYGIKVSVETIATTWQDAVAAAERIGYPVAVKAHGATLQHKSDRDAVRLGVQSADQVQSAFHTVTCNGEVSEALIAEMVPAGVELIVGVDRDASVGPMLVVGFGGILVELLGDTAVALPPFQPGEAFALLRGLRAAPLLEGARGRPACDVAAITTAIEAVAQLALECGDALQSVDINPLIAGPGGVVAVDALIIAREGEMRA